MKQTFTTLLFLCIFIISRSQPVFYGMTVGSGGTICKYESSSHTLSAAYSLKKFIGNLNFQGSLLQAIDGKLYGLIGNGGSSDFGVMFSFDPATSIFTIVKNFDPYIDGGNPYGSLVQATDGKIYGMTSYGGNYLHGVIFSFDPVTSAYLKLKDFDGADGAGPYGSLLQASNGKLYGMTPEGGNSGRGVIFSFDPATSVYVKLKDFNKIDGIVPIGSLSQGSDGKLYGMTLRGGSKGYNYVGSEGFGTIFSFDPATSNYTKLKDLDSTSGRNPYGSLIQAGNGKLYGMTTSGGGKDIGVIFSFDPSTSTYTKEQDFDGANGSNPFGSLVSASDGKLYGMTSYGGSSDLGVIFSFDPANYIYTKEQEFNGSNGSRPYGGSLTEFKDEPTTITTSALSSNRFSPGSSLTVAYTVSRTFNTANIFTAQLSDTSGSFESSVDIGSITSTTGGAIESVIPANAIAGTRYRIRIVASDPLVKGTDNGSDIIIAQAPAAVYRINSGGGQVTTSIGEFAADCYYSPFSGSTYSTTTAIAGTQNQAIYQTERFGTNNTFSYAFPVKNGNYTVVLHFAEIYWQAAGQRIFDVSIEGNKVLDDYDIFAKAGAFTATSETFPITVTDGVLNIDFSSLPADGGVDQPKVSAIEVLTSDNRPMVNTFPLVNADRDANTLARETTTTAAATVITEFRPNTLTAYPNPGNNGHYTVRLPGEVQGQLFYSLVSATGSRLTGGILSLKKPTLSLNFDFAAYMFSSGFYYLILQGKELKGQLKLMVLSSR